MKTRILYSIFSLTLLATLFLSNSGGRAGSANQGNTGAPGDELAGNNPRTCQSCHATGDIQVTMSLEILDIDNNPITAYSPNELYTAIVRIDSAAGPTPQGYGFQVVSLFDADNSDVNGWTESGHSENVQIAESTNTNRAYAEHKGVSSNNEFLIQWQAPEAGKGDISFYAAGNGVNDNGTTSGDGAALPQKLTISEGMVSSIKDLSSLGIDLQLSPNPVKNQLFLSFDNHRQEEVFIKILNAAGQVFYTQNLQLIMGKQTKQIDLSQFSKGLYFVQIANEKAISTKKIVKL